MEEKIFKEADLGNKARVYKKIFRILNYIHGEKEGKVAQGCGFSKLTLFSVSLETCQLVSLMYNSEVKVRNWENYIYVWKAVKFIRLDYIAFKLGFALYLYCAVSILYALILSQVIILFIKCTETEKLQLKHPNIFLRYPLILTKHLHLPVFFITIAYIKYSNSSAILIEYDTSTIIPGGYMILWAIICLILNSFISITQELLIFDSGHSFKNKNAKFSGHCDYIKLLWKEIQVLMYFFLLPLNNNFYYVLTSILALTLSALYYLRLPYYETMINTAIITELLCVGFFALSFILGIYQDNASTIMVLIIILPIFLCITVNLRVSQRMCKLKLRSLEFISRDWEYELILRSKFIENSISGQEITSLAFRNSITKDSKMLYVIESYYLFYIKDQAALSRLHLGVKGLFEGAFDASYQQYRCYRHFCSNLDSEAFRYFQMLEELRIAKLKDKIICKEMHQLCSLVSKNIRNSDEIIDLIQNINPKLLNLRNFYQRLTKIYPTNLDLLCDFGSFLIIFFNEIKAGNSIITKVNSIGRLSPPSGVPSPFKEFTGNIVLELDGKKVWKIVHINKLASEYLSFTITNITDIKIGKIAPILFKDIQSCRLAEIFDRKYPRSYYLFNLEGYLVPSLMQISVDSHHLANKLLLSFMPNGEFVGEVALVKTSGIVIGNSRNFSTMLGYEDNLKGKEIKTIFDDHYQILENLYQPMYYNNGMIIFSSSVEIGKKSVIMLVLLKENKDLDYWEHLYHDKLLVEAFNSPLTENDCFTFNSDSEIEEEEEEKESHKLITNKVSSRMSVSAVNNKHHEINTINLENKNKKKLYNEYFKSLKKVKIIYQRAKIASVFMMLLLIISPIIYLSIFNVEELSLISLSESKLKSSYLTYYLLRAGQLSRFIQIQNFTLFESTAHSELNLIAKNLTIIKLDLLKSSSSNALFYFNINNIPLKITADPTKLLKSINIFDFIDFYITKINEFTGNFTLGRKEDLSLLYLNSFGLALDRISFSDFNFQVHYDLYLVSLMFVLSFLGLVILYNIIVIKLYKKMIKAITKTGKPVIKMQSKTLSMVSNELVDRFKLSHHHEMLAAASIKEKSHMKPKIIYSYYKGYLFPVAEILIAIIIVIFVLKGIQKPLDIYVRNYQNLSYLYNTEISSIINNWQSAYEISLSTTENNYLDGSKLLNQTAYSLELNNHFLIDLVKTSDLTQLSILIHKTSTNNFKLKCGLYAGISYFYQENYALSEISFGQETEARFAENLSVQQELNYQIYLLIVSIEKDLKNLIQKKIMQLNAILIVMILISLLLVFLQIMHLSQTKNKLNSIVKFMENLDLLNPNRGGKDFSQPINH